MYRDYIKLKATLIHQTAKAVLLRDDNGDFWVPKSLLKGVRVRERDMKVKGFIYEWFDKKYLPAELDDENNFTPMGELDDEEVTQEPTMEEAQIEMNSASIEENNKNVMEIFG